MTWIKLCGMRSREDAAAAVAAGADAIGFVIAPGSSRRVTIEEAARCGAGLPIDRYLVTVDLAPEDVMAAAAAPGADGVQPHGEWALEAAAAALDAGLRVLFPVGVDRDLDLHGVPKGAVPLLDTAVTGRHGGSGRPFDWALAAGLDRPFVLAGGLTADTVARAIEIARPWGVDVSTGIESAPGKKDHAEMRRFVEAVR